MSSDSNANAAQSVEASVFDTANQDIAKRYREGTATRQDVRNYINQRYQRLETLGQPPEGYYYPDASKVSEYNRQVYAYNKELNQFRSELYNAIINAETRPTAPTYSLTAPSYAQLSERQQQEQYQRNKTLSDIITLSQSPPSPEQQKKIKELTDILIESQSPPRPETLEPQPGPLAGPAPGSIGERLQEYFTPKAQNLIQFMEQPFTKVTTPLRETSASLKQESVVLASENRALEGLTKYMSGVTLGVVASGFDIATFELRPQLWIDLSRTIGSLAVSPKAREMAWMEIKKDPFSFTAEFVGGALVAPYFKELTVGDVISASEKAGRFVLEKIPTEDPYRGLSQLDRYFAEQPYKIPKFMESGASLKEFKTIDEATQLFKTIKIFTEYKPSASLYEGGSSKIFDEIIQRSKIKQLPVDTYKPTASLYEGKTSKIFDELQQRLKVKEISLDTYKSTAKLYESPTIYADEARQWLKLNKYDLITRNKITQSATLYEGGVFQTPKLNKFLRELNAQRKTFPINEYRETAKLYESPEATKIIDKKVPLSEQVKALEKYKEQTFEFKSEKFFKTTFKEPKPSKLKTIQLQETKLETIGTPANIELVPVILTTIAKDRTPTFDKITSKINQSLINIEKTQLKEIDKTLNGSIIKETQIPIFKEPEINLEKIIEPQLPKIKEIPIPDINLKSFNLDIQIPVLEQPQKPKVIPKQVLQQIESQKQIPKQKPKTGKKAKPKKRKKEVWEKRLDKIIDKLDFDIKEIKL